MFGAQPTTTASTGFGGFGQNTNTAFNTSSFSFGGTPGNTAGSNAAGNSTFGAGFGNAPGTGGFGGFGTPSGTSGGFGNLSASGGFGQNLGMKPTTQGIGFGTPSNQPASNNLFSSNTPNSAAASTGGLFGNAFSQTATTSSGTAPQFGFGSKPQTGTLGTGFGSFGTAATSAAPSSTGFGLGSTNAASGFSFDRSTANAAPATKFFAPATTASATGELGMSGSSFGFPPAGQTSSATGFQLGGASKPAENSTQASFGLSSAPAQPSGFGFGQLNPAAPASTPATGLTIGGGLSALGGSSNLGAAVSSSATQGFGGFSLGNSGAQSSLGTQPTLNLGAFGSSTGSSTGTSIGFGLNASTSVTSTPMLSGLLSQPSSGFGSGFLAKPAQTLTATTSSMATIASVTTASQAPTFNLSAGFSSGGAGSFGSSAGSLGGATVGSLAPAPSTTAVAATSASAATTLTTKGFGSGFSGGVSLVSTAATSLAPLTLTTATAAAAVSTATTSTATASSTSSISATTTFNQLEDLINRWSQELQEQERIFIQQATQVNAWDRVLLDNGEKISQLNLDVEKVKLDHQRLEQDLDFIIAQQNELEEALAPLEASVVQQQTQPSQQLGQAGNFVQHADVEREHIYKLTENIDAQLKRMSCNLKEIIDRINSSSTSLNSDNVMYQISKILNAHMDSLQWIDRNADDLQRKVNDLSSQIDDQKRMHSVTNTSFNSSYRGSPFK